MSVSADALAPRWLGAERRIPESFDEFHGPTSGVVALPGWLAWSGRTAFDVADAGARLTLYQTLVDVGQRDDVARYMNAELLRANWPRLRRLIESPLRRIWEQRLPLAGGYAVQAHELVERPSKDVDFAYSEPIPIAEIVDRLAAAYRAAGFAVRLLDATGRVARMYVETPDGGCEVDVLKEALEPPVRMEFGPVVSFEDAVGLKVRALYGRSVHRNLIDVHAAGAHFSWQALENLCRRHQPEFAV